MYIFAYALIAIEAILLTVGYTSDLEMGWIAAWLFVPAWAAAIGGTVALVLRLLKKAPASTIMYVIAFSVIIHSAFMFEESFVGLIRNSFDEYANRLNVAERAKPLHEVDLGNGRSLYYTDEKDAVYRLNFRFNDLRTISREEVLELARKWLLNNSYQPGKLTVFLNPPIYRKSIFSIKQPGTLSVSCDIENKVVKNGYMIEGVYLGLVYKDGAFSFIETAQAFYQPNK